MTWVGHATWLLRLGGQSILTDPVWSESLGPGITRNVRPGIALEEAAPTVVVVSHNHRDHLDAPDDPAPRRCTDLRGPRWARPVLSTKGRGQGD